MSVTSVIGGTLRALVIAAATGAAAFGLLVVFQPFGKAIPAAVTVSGSPEATALEGRIEALRVALRDTETALDQARSATATVSPDAASRAQYEAQIAAATERRDLALRHAEAIRTSLEAGVTPSSLAEIRDSVVIGQLLTQQVALDTKIATDGARFRANHPTMRALNAQRNALVIQIRQEAANIAAALEAEATIDDAQTKLLEAELPKLAEAPPVGDTSTLETRLAVQRAELDNLVDAYFNIPPATVTARPQANDVSNPLNPMNLAVVGVAAIAAILFQIVLAARRRRPDPSPAEVDVVAWDTDRDAETVIVTEPEPLRKAS
jgi:hypothetical protein